VSAEGWTPEHDDDFIEGQIASAASCYASPFWARNERSMIPPNWPWHARWWKPRTRRDNLVRAGALILAEIERLDRK